MIKRKYVKWVCKNCGCEIKAYVNLKPTKLEFDLNTKGGLYESLDLYNYDDVDEFVRDNLDEKTLEYICTNCNSRSTVLSDVGAKEEK